MATMANGETDTHTNMSTETNGSVPKQQPEHVLGSVMNWRMSNQRHFIKTGTGNEPALRKLQVNAPGEGV